MTELAPGIRVYIAWTNDVQEGFGFARCSTGTITGGPYKPGLYMRNNGEPIYCVETMWDVRLDYDESGVCASETILHPIDDWDEPVEKEVEDEAVL